MPFGQSHEIILGIASKAIWAFFSDVRVIGMRSHGLFACVRNANVVVGSENVPETGPVIL
jgi:hypothetical protein